METARHAGSQCRQGVDIDVGVVRKFLVVGYFLGLLFGPESIGTRYHRNIGELLLDY
jgi:hypothetical protein